MGQWPAQHCFRLMVCKPFQIPEFQTALISFFTNLIIIVWWYFLWIIATVHIHQDDFDL